MSKGRKPDPRRRKTSHPHASNYRVPNGKSEWGWKAGELYGCYGHRTHAHQPCKSDLTDGALSCGYCHAKIESVWRGYLPVWDQDYALRYAIIGEVMHDAADEIPIHSHIVLSREKNPISPLIVRAGQGVTRKLPDRTPYNRPVDMLAICLTLWQDRELTEWFAKNPDGVVTPPPELPTKSDGKPFGPMHKAAAQKYTPPPVPDTAGDVIDAAGKRMMRRLSQQRPSPNGSGSHAE